MAAPVRHPLAIALVLAATGAPARGALADDGAALFRQQVWPLLSRACLGCHGEDDPEGGLRVDSRDALTRGGKSGPAVKVGSAAESLLMKVVRWQHGDLRMPPSRKLPDRDAALLASWIDRGLPWSAVDAPKAASPVADGGARWRPTWWQHPPRQQPLPAVGRSGRETHTDVDRFVLGRLAELGLEPAEAAPRRAWLRRTVFALTGTLPTAAEIRAFENEADAITARAKAVDALLASPRFGRHWAELWVRQTLPEAANAARGAHASARARYAGWMEDTWNRDRPFREIVSAHLPGLAGGRGEDAPATEAFSILAGAHPEPDQREADARVATAGRVFFALSVECARCHDHPTDPLRPADHRALAALLPTDGPDQARPPAQAELASTSLFAAPIDRSPLLARVFVNRVWRALWGRGLVATADDFGARGDAPSHPALLDHLAAKFLASGGSMKWLVKRVVLSAAFAQSGTAHGPPAARDPENVYLWHGPALIADDDAVRDLRDAIAIDAVRGVAGGRARGTPAERLWAGVSAGRDRAPPAVAARTAVGRLYDLVLGRPPTAPELERATLFLAEGGRGAALAEALLDCQELRLLP